MCDNSKLNVPEDRNRKNSVYTYTCKASNDVGSDTRNTSVCKLEKSKMILYVMYLYHFPRNVFITDSLAGPYKQHDVHVTTITGAKLTRKFPWSC